MNSFFDKYRTIATGSISIGLLLFSVIDLYRDVSGCANGYHKRITIANLSTTYVSLT